MTIHSLFFNAPPHIIATAKRLRNRMTPAEKKLWYEMRGKKIGGLKFRRQHPIYFYIADFYCHAIKLVVEVDGPIHNSDKQYEYDENRAAVMKDFGITTLRFTNDEVLYNTDAVIKRIEDAGHPPAPQKEGSKSPER